jgi:hypothetical protein
MNMVKFSVPLSGLLQWKANEFIQKFKDALSKLIGVMNPATQY